MVTERRYRRFTVAPMGGVGASRCGTRQLNPAEIFLWWSGGRQGVIMEGVDEIELGRIVDQAVTSFRRVRSPDDYDQIWEALGRAADAGPSAMHMALGMLGSDDSAMRAIGCDLVGVVNNGSNEPPRLAATALVELGERETDADVLRSIAGALCHAPDPIALPLLVRLASHDDSDVRSNVAMALPAAMGNQVDGADIAAMIGLTGDIDADVRNWATLGLGRQMDVDGSEIRQVLWARVGDDNPDVREEAICGLAWRRDRRSVRLVSQLLRRVISTCTCSMPPPGSATSHCWWIWVDMRERAQHGRGGSVIPPSG
jgi:hypothetical protein